MDEKAGYHDRERPTFIHPLRQIDFNSQLKERENYLAGGGQAGNPDAPHRSHRSQLVHNGSVLASVIDLKGDNTGKAERKGYRISMHFFDCLLHI